VLGLPSNGSVPGVVPHLGTAKDMMCSPSLSRSLSLPLFLSLHSGFLMCYRVCSLSALCSAFVVNAVLPDCLITQTILTNAVRQLDNDILFCLKQCTEHRCPGFKKKTCVNKYVLCTSDSISMPRLDVLVHLIVAWF